MQPVSRTTVYTPSQRLYTRTRAPDWLVRAFAVFAGLALFIGAWGCVAKLGGRLPDPGVVWDAAVKIFADPVLQQGPERPGHRLERAHRRCSAWASASASLRWSASRSAS